MNAKFYWSNISSAARREITSDGLFLRVASVAAFSSPHLIRSVGL